MAFIISGAAAAASAAAIAAGAGATLAGAAGIAAGAATAGAVGAGVGAIGAAATGQDVGKGALMGGVTGLAGGVVGGVASAAGAGAAGAGAIGGAAGGAAGAGAGGEDPLTGALIGGAIGGVGGALAPTPTAGATTPQAGDAVVPTASPNGIGSVNAPAPTDALTPKGLASIPTTPTTPSTGAINEALPTIGQVSPTVAGNSSGYVEGMQGIGNPSTAVPAATPAPIAPTDTSISLQKGIDLVKAHPAEAMQVAGAGIGMLGSTQQEEQKLQPINTTNYLSPNFQRYEATPMYAGGGMVQQGPMNPIVANAMSAAQQTQQQAQQVQQPAQPIAPQQGIPLQQPIPMASGGITDGYSLGGYAHGGNPRLLKGPGSGISDDIPATIGHDGKQPARLATGEFVVPARIVSELGSGDTDAGGKVLQQMVDRIQARRAKTVGKGKVAADSKAHKVLPA